MLSSYLGPDLILGVTTSFFGLCKKNECKHRLEGHGFYEKKRPPGDRERNARPDGAQGMAENNVVLAKNKGVEIQ